MTLTEAKQILKQNGYMLTEKIDDEALAKKYEPIVKKEFYKILLQIQKNLEDEFPGTEIKFVNAAYGGFSDSSLDNPFVRCNAKLVFPENVFEKFDEISYADNGEEEENKIWAMATAGIDEINDSWYHSIEFDNRMWFLEIEADCIVGDELIWKQPETNPLD